MTSRENTLYESPIAQWLERPTGILEGSWVRLPLGAQKNLFKSFKLTFSGLNYLEQTGGHRMFAKNCEFFL